MTKPITSVALLMLYEEGKFQLTDPLGRYMPAFNKVLNETQIWQVCVLLKTAGQPMPADATRLLTTPLDYGVAQSSVTSPIPAQATH